MTTTNIERRGTRRLVARILAAFDDSPLRFLAVFCLIYSAVALWVFMRLGLIQNLHAVVFSESDSRQFLRISELITGHSESVSLSVVGLRPFLFPLYLSIHKFIGIWGYVCLQWLLTLATLFVIFATVTRSTRSSRMASLGVLLMASNLTFMLITLHAMSETLSLFLITCAVYYIASSFRCERVTAYVLACFFLAAATCAKPIFLPFLILWTVLAMYRSFRLGSGYLYAFSRFSVALSPIVLQLIFSYSLSGNATISTAGMYNVDKRYFPAVYGYGTTGAFAGYKSSLAEEGRQRFPGTEDKIRFILRHPLATVRATGRLLRMNLATDSMFTRFPPDVIADQSLSRRLSAISYYANLANLPLHVAGFLAICWLLLSAPTSPQTFTFLLLGCLGYSILVLSVLTYWQGDRIIVVAQPVWAVLYPSLLHELMRSGSLNRVRSLITRKSVERKARDT